MTPGLIAVDIDGTLIGADLQLADAVVSSFQRARDAGWRTVIATGRMFRSALPWARRLGVTEPLITYQGAWVRDPVSFETLWHRVIPEPLALQVIAAVKRHGLHLNLYREDVLMVERLTREVGLYSAHSGIEPIVVPDLEPHAGQATKLVAIAAPEILDSLDAEFKAEFATSMNVVRSNPRYLEFAHFEASKGKALAALSGRMGIEPDRIVAFGDADNDADMLELAGLGVCVGEASVRARQAARRHTEPVGLGVAAVIDELLAP